MGRWFESSQACHKLEVRSHRLLQDNAVGVAQEVRAPDCGSGGRGFESHHPPQLIVILQAGVAKLAHALDLGSSG